MQNTPPILVSAIISTYKAEKFIKGLLDDLLKQTIVRQLEIIVIDSGSPENEGEIVKEYQKIHPNIKYVRTERETVYKAWNRGIELSTGKYLTNANTDDRRRVDAYEVMARFLDEDESLGLAYSDILITEYPNETFDCNSSTGMFKFDEHDRSILLSGGCYVGPMPMWRKSIHEKVGVFDPEFVTSGDLEFWIRASEIFEFKKIHQVLGLYQKREDSVEHVHSLDKSIENQVIIYKYNPSRVELTRNWSKAKVKARLERLSYVFQLQQQEKFDESLDVCNELLTELPNDPDVLYLKATSYFRKKQFNAAVNLFEKVLELDPKHSLALNNLSVWYWANNEKKKALAYMERCCELDPKNLNAKLNLAEMLIKQGKETKAIECFTDILHYDPYQKESLEWLMKLQKKRDPVLSTYYFDVLEKRNELFSKN